MEILQKLQDLRLHRDVEARGWLVRRFRRSARWRAPNEIMTRWRMAARELVREAGKKDSGWE